LDFTNYLGTSVDGESANQPSANADADDNNNLDDEDGVTFPALIKGLPATITVQIKGLGFLNAWIDWNIDGDFSDAGERIASNMVGYDSPLDITFTVPAEAVST